MFGWARLGAAPLNESRGKIVTEVLGREGMQSNPSEVRVEPGTSRQEGTMALGASQISSVFGFAFSVLLQGSAHEPHETGG